MKEDLTSDQLSTSDNQEELPMSEADTRDDEKTTNQAELLESLPEEQREMVLQAIHIQESFQGPLPHPSILKGYEEVVPGSATRIIAMAEKQQQHRMNMERTIIQSDISMQRAGLIAGFLLASVVTVGSMILISTGNDITGLIALLGGIAALAGTFYRAQRQQKAESSEPLPEASNKSPEHNAQ